VSSCHLGVVRNREICSVLDGMEIGAINIIELPSHRAVVILDYEGLVAEAG
jgi:hypothetical protein